MEAAKMALLLGVVVMAFLSSLQLAASARDLEIGRLHLQGGGGGGKGRLASSSGGGFLQQQLACCDRCRQTTWDRWFVCDDRTEMALGCNFGCRNCRCDPTRWPSCQCFDQLYSCPPPCAFGVSDGAAAAEQLRV